MKKLCDCSATGSGCDAIKTAMPNYEAMYNKLLEEHKALCVEVDEMRRERSAILDECRRMKAQLDIVHLIFGKK